MKRFRRVGVAGVAFALLSGFASITALPTTAGATGFNGDPSVCTYNGNTSAVTGVTGGSSIAVSCSGLPSGPTSFLLAESNPLAGVVDPASANSAFADTGALGSCAGAGTGSCTGTFLVPASFTASDPNASCPPSQAQVDAGLVACALAVVNGTTPVNTALLFYTGQPTPTAPTATIAPAGEPGETFSVTGSGWWGGGIFGSPNVAATIPGFTTLVGATPATNTLSATPPVYCTTGHTSLACASATAGTLIAPSFSGSITIPNPVSSGPTLVTIAEPNASGAGGVLGLPASENGASVNATAPFNVLGTPSIQVAPLHGGQGVPVSVQGSNFDPQGSAASVSFNAGLPTADSVGGITVQPDGTFSTTLVVGANEVATIPLNASSVGDAIDASQTPSVASGLPLLTASTAFTVDGASAGPCATTGAPNSCKVNQVIQETITGVPSGLIISEGNGSTPCTVVGATNNADGIHLALQGVTLNGRAQTASGCLNTVRVEDARGTLVGWTTTGQLETDFLGPNVGSNTWDHVIPAQNLTWSPVRSLTFPGDPSGVLSEVAAGAAGTLPTASQSAGLNGATGPYPAMTESSVPVDLCSAAAGGGGGTFNCDAGLALVVPAFVAAGTYQATLDLVIS